MFIFINTTGQLPASSHLDGSMSTLAVTMDLNDRRFASELTWVSQLCPKNTCKGRCGSISKNCTISCNCDSGCLLLNDCCPDFFQVCPNEVTKKSTKETNLTIHSFIQYMTQEQAYSAKILWVNQCPPNSDQIIEEQCTNLTFSRSTIEQYIPVIINGFIFRNRYCALCHNQSDIEDYLEISLSCQPETHFDLMLSATFGDLLKVFNLPSPALTMFSGDNQCHIGYSLRHAPVSVIRFFNDYPEISSCSEKMPEATAELLSLCDSYRSEVVIDNNDSKTSYSNPHCALCNGVALTEVVNASCSESKCKFFMDTSDGDHSFSILFDVTLIGSEFQDLEVSIEPDGVCEIGELHNSISFLCQPVPCPFGRATNGDFPCSKQFKSTAQFLEHNAQERFTVILKFPTIINANAMTIILMEILSAMESSDLIMTVINAEDFNCLLLPLETKSKEEFDENFVCMMISFVPTNCRLEQVFTFFTSQIYESNEDNIIIIFYNFNILQNFICQTGKEIIGNNATIFLKLINYQLTEYVYVKEAGLYWPATAVPIRISSLSEISVTPMISAKVCVIEAGTTLINTEVEAVVTLVGNIVSLLALALTFISLVFFPFQKSFIHILVISLVISLFCAQTLFCIQELFLFQFQLCRIAGILQHYMWLTYFFFMNSIAVEMALRFRNLENLVKARSENHRKGLHIGLLAYSFLGPLFLVSPGVILDVVSETALSPHYGQGKACWINNNSALLYLFVIPFSSLVVLNTCLVVSAIWGIYKISGQNQVISRERSYFWINIKMCSLMGLSWGLGLVAYYTQLAPIRYAFIVFNTLQGVLIFCSFGLTQNVIKCMCNPYDHLMLAKEKLFGHNQ